MTKASTVPALAVSLAGMLVAAPAAAAGGELELMPSIWLLLPLLVFFVLLIPVVDRMLVRPLLRVLDERESRIDGARARAEKLSREAAELMSRCEQAIDGVRLEAEQARRAVLDDARREEASRVRAAREDAERQIESARGEITSALEDARRMLRESAEGLAQEAAQRVLGRPLS